MGPAGSRKRPVRRLWGCASLTGQAGGGSKGIPDENIESFYMLVRSSRAASGLSQRGSSPNVAHCPSLAQREASGQHGHTRGLPRPSPVRGLSLPAQQACDAASQPRAGPPPPAPAGSSVTPSGVAGRSAAIVSHKEKYRRNVVKPRRAGPESALGPHSLMIYYIGGEKVKEGSRPSTPTDTCSTLRCKAECQPERLCVPSWRLGCLLCHGRSRASGGVITVASAHICNR
jgi:hypothetical protein